MLALIVWNLFFFLPSWLFVKYFHGLNAQKGVALVCFILVLNLVLFGLDILESSGLMTKLVKLKKFKILKIVVFGLFILASFVLGYFSEGFQNLGLVSFIVFIVAFFSEILAEWLTSYGSFIIALISFFLSLFLEVHFEENYERNSTFQCLVLFAHPSDGIVSYVIYVILRNIQESLKPKNEIKTNFIF